MQSDTTRDFINGRSPLQELVGPIRERLEDSVRELSYALARAGESMKRVRMADVAAIIRRSPLASLAVAAGIGFLVGLSLWARDE